MVKNKEIFVTYRERVYLDKFRAIDKLHTFKAYGYFDSNNLRYYRINSFSTKVVAFEDIVSEEFIEEE